MRAPTLHRVLGALLLGIAAHHLDVLPQPALPTVAQATAGVLAGPGTGVVAAVLGVAGSELLIPTVVLLYGVDAEFAGSLSLLVSPPTMVVAFLRYSRDQAFGVLRRNARFVVPVAVGPVAGGLLLGTVFEAVLVPLVVVSSPPPP